MDFANYNNIVKLAKDQSEIDKVKLILDYPNSNMSEVPDPYFGGNEYAPHDITIKIKE